MRIFLSLLIAIINLSVANADPLADWQKADAEALAAWEKLPLTQRNITFVSGEPGGYGIYNVRQSNIFEPDDKLVTYAEAIGYGWKQLPNGMYEIGIAGDFAVKDEKGKVILEQKGFSRVTIQNHTKPREFFIHYTLNLTGAPEGNYTLTYTLHDATTGESTSFDQPFTISK